MKASAPQIPIKFPEEFQRKSLALIHRLIDLTSSAFYLLNPDMRRHGVAVFNVDESIVDDYRENYFDIDPLNPGKFQNTDDIVVTIDDQIAFEDLKVSPYYPFMVRHDHRYVADMFFRSDSEIIAVLSMLRHQSLKPFSAEELGLLRALQPFLEFTLNAVYVPNRRTQRQSLAGTYAFTSRELDVVELLIAGRSNKEIARKLDLSLATIKTHLGHIFQKANSSSRTELMAAINSHINIT
jgi:DNA-binding CsgD family transcriptional regulator